METDPTQDPQGEDSRAQADWLAERIGEARVGEFSQAGEAQERGAEQRDAWQQFLGECRSDLNLNSIQDERRARSLAQSILNSTVREDLSVRADWRLVAGFVRQRMASSGLLRVVAASLLLHLCALPVMAYYVWVLPEPEPSLQIHLMPDDQELPYGVIEPEVLPGPQDSAALPESLGDLELLSDLFRAHRALNSNGESGPADQVLWADDLGLILRVEMLCARHAKGVQSETHRAGAKFTLEQLGECLRRLRSEREQPFLKRLAASAWLRSRSLRLDIGSGFTSLEASLMEFQCRDWLAPEGALQGAEWREACARAEAEIENSAK